jgi:hypothetical protein
MPEDAGSPSAGPQSDDNQIVRAAIHPAIGIARVGNSEEQFFLGPEVDHPTPMEPGSYKDETGALKRQAARFRIYGYNAAGEAVAELTADDAEISWTVHVANQKSAWYEFQLALDIPEASDPGLPPSNLRNAGITGEDRARLVIDPGQRTIAGRSQAGPAHWFASGEFWGTEVYLGEVRTDEAGRLIFLGGRGVSASYDGSPVTTFANNDKWHDDVSDGPVTAQVSIDGRSLDVDPAWVVVAPPNYGPEVVTVRTVYDLLCDAYVQCGWMSLPERVSFTAHVLPVFERLNALGWVNKGFASKFGFGGREHFLDRDYLGRLASEGAEQEELRQQIWTEFRNWERDGESPVPWPWIYGDSMSLPPVSARQHSTLSDTQMLLLERWAAGDFDADLDLDATPPRTIEDVPLAQQPETLDRAALTFCLADAFHPGCEMTWPIRHTSMYMAPFRFRHRAVGDPERDYGTQLTPEAVGAVDGPLYGQSPGSISRWMAVPWQADTASCLSGYYMGYGPRYDPYLPTFWAARVPNDVLARRDYDIVMNESRPLAERTAAFENRASWLRWLHGNHAEHRIQMVTDFGKMGVVEVLPGPEDGAFPSEIFVESEVGFDFEVDDRRNSIALHVPEAHDPEVAEVAIDRAIVASGHPPEHVNAGYMANVDPFRRARR